MSLDEAKESDVKKEVEGFGFVIDKSLDEQFEAVNVDFKKGIFGRGYVITLTSDGGGCCS
ncbi:hypothetical protein Amet_4614 [Alkaliphilus metalliredigens QYMF]|uniref:HesB/YadR/YfhF-family protein n=1 Tax=Alkaliphilus metalliredigens (strain QYMF) TaxID=293826 RepID=A6TWW7_ALKMQ|nr:hypothetical protein [Alkaliphilus metalliredigens]ABR50685.1 hypothetical protein Amet_4614 [Alkaliphilus metalliredigens QYMF]